MQTKRIIMLSTAGAAVAFRLVLVHTFNSVILGSVPHADSSGERLSVATFGPNEQIVMSSHHGDRGARIRTYRFYWAAGAPHVDIRGNVDSMDYVHTSEPLVTGWPLTDVEAEGLERMVQWFRSRAEEYASGVALYEFEYFRSRRAIGRERFVGFRLPGEIAYLERDAAGGHRQPESEYSELALRNRLTAAELTRLLPFECLEIRHPDVK